MEMIVLHTICAQSIKKVHLRSPDFTLYWSWSSKDRERILNRWPLLQRVVAIKHAGRHDVVFVVYKQRQLDAPLSIYKVLLLP